MASSLHSPRGMLLSGRPRPSPPPITIPMPDIRTRSRSCSPRRRRNCISKITGLQLAGCLLLLAFIRIVVPNTTYILESLHDTTQPSRFFKSYQMGDTGLVLRPWKWPVTFKIESGLTKQFARTQPIPELRDGPRPTDFGCQKNPENALVYIGVFSTASRWHRRTLLRRFEKPTSDIVNGAKVEFRFILGKPENATDMHMLEKEMKKFGDIVLLDDYENMNNGKTHAFYRYLATRSEPTPQFAFKTDDDALVVIPNLVTMLEKLDCNKLVYTGSCSDFTCGLNRGYPYFFTGMMYGLSAPLFQWIGNAKLRQRRMRGNEDVRTAQYLLNLHPDKKDEQLIRLNLDGRMGDWRYWNGDEWQFNPRTVLAIHGMKTEAALNKVSERLARSPKKTTKYKKTTRRGYKIFAKKVQ